MSEVSRCAQALWDDSSTLGLVHVGLLWSGSTSTKVLNSGSG
ncbi:MAG: hypothetical protein ABSC00_03550 [Acidimicrobiales bacterium]|jgi:hypothetical protein